MSNKAITIEILIRKLKLCDFNKNEFIFFQEFIEKIYKLTENKKIYTRLDRVFWEETLYHK